jgi:hypothetical protein
MSEHGLQVPKLELKASGYASHINIISVETHIYKYIYMQAKSQVSQLIIYPRRALTSTYR